MKNYIKLALVCIIFLFSLSVIQASQVSRNYLIEPKTEKTFLTDKIYITQAELTKFNEILIEKIRQEEEIKYITEQKKEAEKEGFYKNIQIFILLIVLAVK